MKAYYAVREEGQGAVTIVGHCPLSPHDNPSPAWDKPMEPRSSPHPAIEPPTCNACGAVGDTTAFPSEMQAAEGVQM